MYIELCLIQKWLREKHKIQVIVNLTVANSPDEEKIYRWGYWKYDTSWGGRISKHNEFPFYEDALLEGVKEAIQLI
jgi:hypothetical protein